MTLVGCKVFGPGVDAGAILFGSLGDQSSSLSSGSSLKASKNLRPSSLSGASLGVGGGVRAAVFRRAAAGAAEAVVVVDPRVGLLTTGSDFGASFVAGLSTDLLTGLFSSSESDSSPKNSRPENRRGRGRVAAGDGARGATDLVGQIVLLDAPEVFSDVEAGPVLARCLAIRTSKDSISFGRVLAGPLFGPLMFRTD